MTTHNNSQTLFTQHAPKSMIAYGMIAKSKRRLQSAVLLLSWVIITGCNNTTIDADGSMQTPSTNALSNSVKITPTSYRDMIEKKRESRFTEQKMQAIDRALAIATEQIAEHLTNKSFVADLHQEVLAKFDNQTEVLLSKVLQGSAKKNFSKKNPFEAIYSQELKSIEQDVNAPIHLYWYNAEQWDKTTTPIIAFVKCKEHKNKQAVLDGFSSDGKKIKVSQEMAEKQPVIIVNFNERVKIDPKKREEIDLPQQVPSYSNSSKPNTSVAVLLPGAPVTVELANVAIHGSRTDFEGWFDGDPEFYYTGWEQPSVNEWRIFTNTNGAIAGTHRYFPHYWAEVAPQYPGGPYDYFGPDSWWFGTAQYHTWYPVMGPTQYNTFPLSPRKLWHDRGHIGSSQTYVWIDFYEEDAGWLFMPNDYLGHHLIGSGVVTGSIYKQDTPIEAQYRTFR